MSKKDGKPSKATPTPSAKPSAKSKGTSIPAQKSTLSSKKPISKAPPKPPLKSKSPPQSKSSPLSKSLPQSKSSKVIKKPTGKTTKLAPQVGDIESREKEEITEEAVVKGYPLLLLPSFNPLLPSPRSSSIAPPLSFSISSLQG